MPPDSFYHKRQGYNEFKINKNLSTIINLNKYNIHADTTQKNIWTVTGDSLSVFTMDVDHLNITVDDHNIIKYIAVYTKEITFDNYKDWQSNLNSTLIIVNGDVGKQNSDDLSRRSSKDLLFAWSFQKTQTSVSLKLSKASKLATNIKCNYIFTWREKKKDFLDVKY
ncbi:MAG: hypothetical protein EOP47_18030 [Sphingobacteriaceae bacterium]|nr:MAG: hypothetical protein EOP47_18030 [Sphingobacteriaceae bacterium]